VNDPPTVRIIVPEDGDKFFETDKIFFDCIAEDVDLFLANSQEKLYFSWSSNLTDNSNLGTEQQLILTSNTLPPGAYNITVEVTDFAGETGSDVIHIIVKEKLDTKKDSDTFFTQNQLWLGIIILIIITVILIALLVLSIIKRKKEKMAPSARPEMQVLEPTESYQLPTIAPAHTELGTVQTTTPQIMPRTIEQKTPMISTSSPTPELPPADLTNRTDETSDLNIQPGVIGPSLDFQKKMRLLEKQLLLGKIDQQKYLNLKAKYELEAKPYQPAPQLPPAPVQPQPQVTQESQEIQPQPQQKKLEHEQ
jgi:hypothetical protein